MNTLGSRAIAATAGLALALALLLLAGCGAVGNGVADGGDKGRTPAAASPGTGPRSPAPTDAGETEATDKTRGTNKTQRTPKGGVPQPEDVDRTDADAVSKGALTAMWTYDTAIDRGPADAGVRTADAGWLTPSYAGQLRERRARSGPGAQWGTWAKHRAYTKVSLTKTEDAAMPDDTDTVAWRQWTVAPTPHGRDGWTQEPTSVVAFVHLVRKSADAPWQVADITAR
ncbi:hypothetical protein ACQEU8_04070 [Streptomyces sp. CA-250714]|uniref:hypothetical protein n=1 Tax=Streptomyces sp. CA-250714 TaxID=3240060 RepID=UPI003D902EA4